MEFEAIIFEKNGNVATVTLNRPEVMNARNGKMCAELVQVYNEVASDPDIRVLIVTGAGEKAFCTGQDLKGSGKREESIFLNRRQKKRTNDRDTEVLANLDKPVIAAINGYALGGGLEIALACDLRIAVDTAKLGLPEVKRGMIPGAGGTQRLPRIVGKAKALELLFTGKMIPAQEAAAIGLVNEVVPKEELLARATKIAEEIAENAPIAVMFAKEAVNKGIELPLREALAVETDLSSLLDTTEDRFEGPRAFAEKRKPVWKGR